MTVFAAVALLVGAFIINNTFAILVAQRTKELALLRAIGASTKQVRRSVAIEAAVVGVVASALGLVAGVGVAKGIGALWRSFGVTMPEGPLVVRPASLVIAFVLGVAVTVGSALLPARRAARVAPVEAMRSVAVESTRTSRLRVVHRPGPGRRQRRLGARRHHQRHGADGAARGARRVPRRGHAEPGAGPSGGPRARRGAAAADRRPRAAGPGERRAQPAPDRCHGVRADDRGGAGGRDHRVRRLGQVVGEPLLRQGVPRRPGAGDRRLGVRRGQPAAGRPTWPAPTRSRPRCRASSPRPRSATASTELAVWPAATVEQVFDLGRLGRVADRRGHRRHRARLPARGGQGPPDRAARSR